MPLDTAVCVGPGGCLHTLHERERTSAPVKRIIAHAIPAVATATIVPLILFYSLSAAAGTVAGILASLAWAYLMLGRQLLASGRVSGLLILASVTLTIRLASWTVHQSTFTYFFVPVVETVLISGLFLVSCALGRPLLVCLARDFLPVAGDSLARVTHRGLVCRLSCLWGIVYLSSAATSVVLLRTLNLHWFPLIHQLSGWGWTITGIAVSVIYGRRHAPDLLDNVSGGQPSTQMEWRWITVD